MRSSRWALSAVARIPVGEGPRKSGFTEGETRLNKDGSRGGPCSHKPKNAKGGGQPPRT